MEEALYDSEVMRRFVGIDLGRKPVPDETMILNFRHLLEPHELCTNILRYNNKNLRHAWLEDFHGTIVDAPSSTKNAAKEP